MSASPTMSRDGATGHRPATSSAASDIAYCRAVLPLVSRTFAINIRLLRGSFGDAVRTAYLLCRAADALEDSWPGDGSRVRVRFDLLLSGLAGDASAAEALARSAGERARGGPDLELVAHLPRVLGAFSTLELNDRGVIAEAVRTLANGMCRYAARAAARDPESKAAYLDTQDELHHYCFVVAGCVGVMLERLFAVRAPAEPVLERTRLELAPIVGEALQLTNILLDWPADLRRRRCYVPRQWLVEHDLRVEDLTGADRPAVREIANRLETLARASLARVPDYIDTIPTRHVRYRLFCVWPALWAMRSLRHAHRDPHFPWGPNRPRLPKSELWSTALHSFLRIQNPNALRKMYEKEGRL